MWALVEYLPERGGVYVIMCVRECVRLIVLGHASPWPGRHMAVISVSPQFYIGRGWTFQPPTRLFTSLTNALL